MPMPPKGSGWHAMAGTRRLTKGRTTRESAVNDDLLYLASEPPRLGMKDEGERVWRA